jgi:drug/metabolite transporter (DMT)-like permease
MGEALWIPLTLAAAFLQNLRSALQKRLTGPLSVGGAAYVRFCYALPFAWLYLLLLAIREPVPAGGPAFWAFCVLGSIGQALATAALLAAFTVRSFAVSTALSKTEVVQAAVVGWLVLEDRLSAWGTAGIASSCAGVLLLAMGVQHRPLLHDARGVALGLLAGTGLAVSVVGFRGAALSLPEGSVAMRAATTLAVALGLQTLGMALFLAWREPGQLRRVARQWRAGLWTGVAGAAASVGWFTAMTLQTAALVRALGQVELLFALLTSGWLFGERLGDRELLGIGALLLGIALVLTAPGAG